MKKNLLLFAAAICAAVSPISAGQWDKLTKLDVKETILIPGRELPPGKYVMKLMDSQSDRHIVMIYNEDQSKLEATILAIPNQRLQPTGDTVLQYWETPAGVPPALRAWFYPGDNFGQEFAYPKDMAAELSRVNNAKVMYYNGPNTAENTADTFKSAEVYDAPNSGNATNAAVTPAPAPSPVVNEAPAKPEPTQVAEAAPAPQPVVTPEPTPAPQPVLMAQNREPAPAPAPMNNDQLPQTAGELPMIALIGLSLLGVAGVMRLRTVRS
jgi:hypothetical protein